MKDFLLIANQNVITYKEFFPLLKERKVNVGCTKPKEYTLPNGEIQKSGDNLWFTTMHTPDKKKLVLTKKYRHEDYKHYDNYNAIEVSRIKDIPYNYDGVMGVPITILDYDLDNVEVDGLFCDSRADGYGLVNGTPTYVNEGHPKWQGPVVDGKAKYCRILIRRKQL